MAVQTRANQFCRVVRVKNDPSRIDEAIKFWTHDVLPRLKKQKGSAGASFIGSRRSGYTLTVSYWESETAMKDARARVRTEELKSLEKTGGTIVQDDECEVALLERFQPPKAGVWARITTVQGDPVQADRAIANFRGTIMPSIKVQPGARASLFFVSRESGRCFTGSVWETEQELQRSETPMGEVRTQVVKTFNGHDPKTEAFEIFATEILTPASVG